MLCDRNLFRLYRMLHMFIFSFRTFRNKQLIKIQSEYPYIHVSYYIVQNTNSFKEIMVMFQVIFFFYISVCESKENEVYYKCQLEACYTTCQHLKTPPPCPSIAAGCFQPACICKGGFLRNAEGKCVPEDQCRKYLN